MDSGSFAVQAPVCGVDIKLSLSFVLFHDTRSHQ